MSRSAGFARRAGPCEPAWGRWVRWLLVPCAATAGFFGAVYLGLLLLFAGPFPRSLAPAAADFLMGALTVLAGALVAPGYRAVIAALLLVLAAAGARLLGFELLGAVTGGIVATALVAWWFHPRRTARLTSWVAAGASVALLGFIGLVYAHFIDMPPRPASLAPELSHALGADASRIAAFYRYELGGFIDREWLWRIDAEPDVVARVVAGLDLRRASAVPERFWRMSPHYWPRALPPRAEAFQSRFFPAEERGPDGSHYFLLHDRERGRALVWVKDNF